MNEQNPRVRKQLLDRAQQLIYERMVFIPVLGSVFTTAWAAGPRCMGWAS